LMSAFNRDARGYGSRRKAGTTFYQAAGLAKSPD
jgi:hypothetical protein